MLMEKTKNMGTASTHTRENRTLALFDFDGTITYKDTLFAFIRFVKGRSRFFWGMIRLLPMLIANKLGFIPNDKAKEKLLAYFFKGMNYATFKRYGEKFCEEKLPQILKQAALDKINWHRSKHHRVVVVSASVEEWIRPWTESMGIELLCTEMEINDNRLTGRFSTPNCNGEEKVKRIKELIDLNDYPVIYAYGDSKGDEAMLAIATKPLYKHFD